MNKKNFVRFIDEVNDYITPEKRREFDELTIKYLIHFTKEKKVKTIPDDLEERLNEPGEVIDVQFNFNNETEQDEIVRICKEIFNYVDCVDKRNKKYYFNLGMLLSKLREKISDNFIEYAKNEFKRSKTIINDYIRFYNECSNHPILITCDLSYREIMKFLPEIRKILDTAGGVGYDDTQPTM